MDLWFEWINYRCPQLNIWCIVIHNHLFVLVPFKCPVTLNYFAHFLSYTNFTFETISYCSSCSFASFSTMTFNFSRPYSIFYMILLYNKEEVSRTFCSLSVSASQVARADTALYNSLIVCLIQLVMFIYIQNVIEIFKKSMDRKMIKEIFPWSLIFKRYIDSLRTPFR